MTTTHTGRRRRALALGAVTVVALALAGCSGTASGTGTTTGAASTAAPTDATPGTVTLVTHDSFALSDGLLASFESATGITVKQVAPGDGGTLVNQLILTKDAPLGDLAYGVDNSFASRAIAEGVFAPTTPTAPAAADAAKYAVDDSGSLTAIDYGDVCLNVDHSWFTAHSLAEPTTLEDLTKPEYKDLLVVPNAATSSPGLAFLLATIGKFGADGWQAYWKALQANGLQVADGWSDAYYTDFTGGGGEGTRPVVLSYASSPPDTIPDGGDTPTTGALLGTCFRQVEYAGVLAGAKNPQAAAKLLDFLLSDAVQADIPGSMYMYPVSTAVTLPPVWAQWAPLADHPYTVEPADISAHRDDWIKQWTDLVTG
ncbi:thiamine ABC transporter substrate-binding protein [Cellulomonas sp. WB94]|uniref:thiamine ABC transporter substrate-binding protein n=1 Tax=Cellulomonas sp. WB94 TaxID=2173174 RepID=UPI000D56AA62|nr:thiamine ABC transporter substrate-binding protein [Cellulomonas sp. WB94]PVU83111.1 thiamine ABC transporter substrate-binding protein [Cellulomonas sp. WB94]